MANDPWRDLRSPTAFGAHVFGERIDQVLHRCPDCPLGDPACHRHDGRILGRPGCRTCLGAGDVTEGTLALWTARRNAEVARDAR